MMNECAITSRVVLQQGEQEVAPSAAATCAGTGSRSTMVASRASVPTSAKASAARWPWSALTEASRGIQPGPQRGTPASASAKSGPPSRPRGHRLEVVAAEAFATSARSRPSVPTRRTRRHAAQAQRRRHRVGIGLDAGRGGQLELVAQLAGGAGLVLQDGDHGRVGRAAAGGCRSTYGRRQARGHAVAVADEDDAGRSAQAEMSGRSVPSRSGSGQMRERVRAAEPERHSGLHEVDAHAPGDDARRRGRGRAAPARPGGPRSPQSRVISFTHIPTKRSAMRGLHAAREAHRVGRGPPRGGRASSARSRARGA